MKKLLMVALVALVVTPFLPIVAQARNKAQGEPTSVQQSSAPSPDPLSSFQQIVKDFNAFFSAGPQKLIMQWAYEENSNRAINVLKFTGQDISYDVEKTNSLVSPYLAVINMKLTGWSNQSCGDISGRAGGWSTVTGAMSAANRSECYKYWPREQGPTVISSKFVFAFQDGRWVFTDAVDLDHGHKWDLFLSVFGNGEAPITRFSEPEAQELNSAWRNLVQK